MTAPRTWLRRHWLLTSVGVGVLALAAAAVVVYLVVLQNHATPISLGEALHRYRTHHGAASAGVSLPPPGVYTYRTRGSEALNLPGGDRSYPDRSTMTVTPSGCGVTVRWAAIAEHTEEYDECLGPAKSLALATSSVTETFFGVVSHDKVTCSPGSYLRPPTLRPGETWSLACGAPQVEWRGTGTVIGPASVAVGSARIPAVHTRVVFSFAGRNTGTNPSDYWFALDDSRLLRWRGTVDVSQGSSPLGSVRYHEQFDLSLVTTAPVH
ncbi:MAG TPA: hypothetical protein VG869_03580 [Acidimicrobiia bacterium]|jgi:hypothetical protein|nr:hypothetical protein [Acidimicrobiia bacterium]